MSSRRSSSPLEKSVGLTVVSLSFWRSPDSAAKRSPVYSGQSWISHNEFGPFRNRGPRTQKPTSYICPSNRWLCWHGQTSQVHTSSLCSEPSPSRNSVEQNVCWIKTRE